MAILKINESGIGSILVEALVPVGRTYRLVSVELVVDVAPTTAESYTITLDAGAGSAHDATLYSRDLAAVSATTLIWWPDAEVYLHGGDCIDVAYANTDARTWGVAVVFEEVN